MSIAPEPLPLATARQRLGRPPGRPRTRPVEPPPPPAHTSVVEKAALQTGNAVGLSPRLLAIPAAGHYLGGLCPKTMRGLIASGALAQVRIGRRILLDVRDLDRLIQANKESRT